MTKAQGNTIDWTGAIEHNRVALLRILAALFAMAGIAEGETAATLPRHLRNAVNRILRPAESAARRLIVIAARGMEVAVPPLSPRGRESLLPRPGKCPEKAGEGVGRAKSTPRLPLLDPLKRFDFGPRRRYAKSFPRITCIGLSEPTPIPGNRISSPDDEMDARRICRRLAALKRALTDLDGHARRLARWRARRDAGLLRAARFSPLRPGWPPGHRKRPLHEVDAVLRECHSLAGTP